MIVVNHWNLLFVNKAKGAVVRSIICGVPPNTAKNKPPNTWEYNTFCTSEKINFFIIFVVCARDDCNKAVTENMYLKIII